MDDVRNAPESWSFELTFAKTPRHLTPPPHGSTGNGLVRQCRDFELFEAWAKERTACYTFPTEEEFNDPLETRFRDCPDNSEYLPTMRKYFEDHR